MIGDPKREPRIFSESYSYVPSWCRGFEGLGLYHRLLEATQLVGSRSRVSIYEAEVVK